MNKMESSEEIWSTQAFLCGTICPDGGEPEILIGPKPLKIILAQYAICDDNMRACDCPYVYIVDCKGNRIAEKWV